MGTYSLEGLADFIFQLFDKESEDEMWEMWLHKENTENFESFKKKYFKKMRKPAKKTLSKDDELKIIERNTQFIKPITKGGESEI